MKTLGIILLCIFVLFYYNAMTLAILENEKNERVKIDEPQDG